jgi:iron(III) transport system ATP-binding protein
MTSDRSDARSSAPSDIVVEHLAKRYAASSGPVAAAADMHFSVPAGAFFTLLGPSGCGKTTTLRCLAGLERPDAGRISVGRRVLFSMDPPVWVAPSRRRVGMVFQSYALWPHMNVYDNIAFPLQAAGVRRNEARQRVARVLELLELGGLEARSVTGLSGGQQQRVALARAIVPDVDVLLLDEPLSNLDAKIRAHVRRELREMQARLGVTTVYVTHDQEEALALSDILAVVREGVIVEAGAPRQLYEFPQREFTARFLGSVNVLAARRLGRSDNGLVVETPLGRLTVAGETAPEDTLIAVRPEHIGVRTVRPTGANSVEATLRAASFMGTHHEYVVEAGGMRLLVKAMAEPGAPVGERVWLTLPPERCRVVQADGQPRS